MFIGSSATGFHQTLESLLYMDIPKVKPTRGIAITCFNCGGGYGPLRKLSCGKYACNNCFEPKEAE